MVAFCFCILLFIIAVVEEYPAYDLVNQWELYSWLPWDPDNKYFNLDLDRAEILMH